MAALVVGAFSGACADDDPTDDGPPRIEASIEESADEADVLETLGRLRAASPAGIEEIDVDIDKRLVVIELTSTAEVVPAERAKEMHAARGEMLRILREPESVIAVTSINWNPA